MLHKYILMFESYLWLIDANKNSAMSDTNFPSEIITRSCQTTFSEISAPKTILVWQVNYNRNNIKPQPINWYINSQKFSDVCVICATLQDQAKGHFLMQNETCALIQYQLKSIFFPCVKLNSMISWN